LGDLAAVWVAAVLVGLPAVAALVFIVSATLLLLSIGASRGGFTLSLSDELPGLAGRIAIAAAAAVPFALSPEAMPDLLRTLLLAILLVAATRGPIYAVWRWARGRGLTWESVIILGAGQTGVTVARVMMENPKLGLKPLGFVDNGVADDLPLPILGGADDLAGLIRIMHVPHVVVAFGGAREVEMLSALRKCDDLPVQVHVLPRFFELGVSGTFDTGSDLAGFPVVRLRRSARNQLQWPVKRVFDIVVALVVTTLALPALPLIALAVRLSSPGPILYKQKRVGQDGRTFDILKFRTMAVNNDSQQVMFERQARGRAGIKDQVGGGRVTRAGKFLRRTHLDELPQVFNVLRGEMSIVGPRPELPYIVDRFSVEVDNYEHRHRVPAGITGWAQVHGLIGDTSIEDRVRLDNRYIQEWSPWKDVVILFRTVASFVTK